MVASMEELQQVEGRSPARLQAERVLVLAPTYDDAALLLEVLRAKGFGVVVIDDLPSLTSELQAGAGLLVVASEALVDDDEVAALRETLNRQQSWSEIPILLLGGGQDDPAPMTELLGSSAQIVLLDRPLGVASFITAAQAALRSRRRQYEVKRLLDELAHSADDIRLANEQATRAKDDFLATLGHELRSPMAAIRGWIELLRTGDLPAEDAATALAMIDASTRVQSHIIEDLMDVSKIIAGKVMIDPTVVELAPLVENIVATFRVTAKTEGIELTVDLPGEPLVACVDGLRLQQVGWNLISNAIKFTPRGGSVHVALERNGDRAVIRVRDSGEGMPADLLPHVFERYRQAEGAPKKRQGGLGLGLAIVRHLVESHGGTIEARSEGLGHGAEFIVSLPLHPA
jgi:signal transduction histidine kinase